MHTTTTASIACSYLRSFWLFIPEHLNWIYHAVLFTSPTTTLGKLFAILWCFFTWFSVNYGPFDVYRAILYVFRHQQNIFSVGCTSQVIFLHSIFHLNVRIPQSFISATPSQPTKRYILLCVNKFVTNVHAKLLPHVHSRCTFSV